MARSSNNSDHGMHVANSSHWRQFNDVVAFVRMPLFACISGYFFRCSPSSWASLERIFQSKLRRLGIPLLVISSIFYATSCAMQTDFCIASPWQIFLYPYAHYWFIQAILLIMACVAVMTFALGGSSLLFTVIALPLSILVAISGFRFSTNLFSVNGALYLLPFFLLGHTLSAWSLVKFLDQAKELRHAAILVVGTLLHYCILPYAFNYAEIASYDARMLQALRIAIPLLLCLLLILVRVNIRLLAIIGPYAYAIYLIHPFFTSASRRLISALDHSAASPIIFVVGVLAGLAMPVVVYHFVIKHRISALLFLGIKIAAAPPPARRIKESAKGELIPDRLELAH